MENKKLSDYRIRLRTDRILGLVALLLLIVASILGYQNSLSDSESVLKGLLEKNQHIRLNSENIYEVYDKGNTLETGYVFSGSYMGYGGPLKVAVRVDTNIVIQDLIIISHNETPSYVAKVLNREFQRQIIGKTYTDEIDMEQDLNGVSGATYTSRALAGAAKEAIQKIAVEQVAYEVPESLTPKVSFGFPEILVILLFVLSLFGVYSHNKWKKALRLGIMLSSLILMGIWLSAPLSILKINTLLLGYWPEWHNGLYWYLIIGGTILTLLITNKNIYCSWICPFGAAQDCLGILGKASYKLKGRTRRTLMWGQRALAYAAIAAALYFRNPGKLNFEIFGTFFNLTGSIVLFVITSLYVIGSLFIKRPYCDTLCPVHPFGTFLMMIKKWIMPKKILTQ